MYRNGMRCDVLSDFSDWLWSWAHIALNAALERLKTHYLDHPIAGGWYDQFDRDGRSLVDAIPASTMYHVLCAITEADRVLG